jgi:NADPH:quinone reductase-like Zn-dependent oxidoreductase
MRIMSGLRKPENRVLGRDVARTVEAVGRRYAVQPGDGVYGKSTKAVFAEYTRVSENVLALARTAVGLFPL